MTDRGRGLLAASLAVLLTGCSLIAAPADTPVPAATPTGAPSAGQKTPKPTRKPRPTPTATPTPAATPTPTPDPTPPPPIEGLAELLGTDGRFTVLILGSDARRGSPGERTDTIMLATIDPTSGRVAMISLPRDTIHVPIGPGKDFEEQITGAFQAFEGQTGSRKGAYKKLERSLEYAFGIEIDRYALSGFIGVQRLIDAIGGVNVFLDAPLVDPTVHISSTRKGLILRKGKNHLNGKKALAFARTRHSDTDYERARRQQYLIAVTVQKVLDRGLEALPALAALATDRLETDIPLSAAPALFALARRAKLGNVKSVVLGPTTFATEGPSYTNTLKMDVVRAVFKRWFAPVGG